MIAVPPLQHADYPNLDNECECEICVDWRQKHAAYQDAAIIVADHSRSCCCPDCLEMRKRRGLYDAAMNRRDLYISVSWHAAQRKGSGSKLMIWIQREMKKPGRSEGWWSKRSPYYSTASWLLAFERSVTAMVSGVAVAVSGA
jgi:hypothetical protein